MTDPIKVLRDIIQHELELDNEQVMLAYQKFNIPTKGLYIVLTNTGASTIIASIDDWEDDGAGGLTEVQTLTILDSIQIDIMSFGSEARTRSMEVAMAIHSLYAEQAMEENSLQIARQPGPFRDTSFLESTEFLQRYTTDVKITSAMTKRKAADYFSDLSRAVPPLVSVDA